MSQNPSSPFCCLLVFLRITLYYQTTQTRTPPSKSAISDTRAARPSDPPRLSILRRTSGSVLDRRRLNRQSAKARLTPSVSSSDSASPRYAASTRSMAAPASATRKFVSPELGKAAKRSSTQSARDRPDLEISSATNSHGIIPLSQ